MSLTACTTFDPNKWSRAETSYQIYSIFCDYYAEKLRESQIDIIVLSEKTGFDEAIREVRDNAELGRILLFFPALEKATFDDLLAENSSTSVLTSSVKSKKRIVFLSDEEQREFFKEGGSESFFKKYNSSQGIMTFSKVGYSRDRKQAVLYYGNWCGRKCGGGGLALFRFSNGEWKLELIFPIWIS